MTATSFRPQQPWGEILLDWWQRLADDSGGRSSLKRAADISAVVLCPAYQRLYRRLRTAGWPDEPWRNDRLAAAAGLLAHVREAASQSLPEAMGEREADKPRVSPLRFRRLLEARDVDALFVGLRRTLPLLQHRADVLALASDVVGWGDGVRKRWAYAYDWPDKAAA
ncbi:MAG: type I-E CRISPR-associated protein Cse2/CasB [Rubrivivax sp.]|nr:type I-E CRISPR-associated protein Cse2/CasB [Rubrivivax sp.]